MIRRPPRSTQSRSSAASDVYKRQQNVKAVGPLNRVSGAGIPTSTSARDISVFLATTISLPLARSSRRRFCNCLVVMPRYSETITAWLRWSFSVYSETSLPFFSRVIAKRSTSSRRTSYDLRRLETRKHPAFGSLVTNGSVTPQTKKPLYRRQQAQRLHTPNQGNFA